jgi:hypothetical protein
MKNQNEVTQLRKEAAREAAVKNNLTIYQANQIEKSLWATFIQRDVVGMLQAGDV